MSRCLLAARCATVVQWGCSVYAILAVYLLPGLAAWAGEAAPAPSCRILAYPAEVYEGQPFEVTVAFELPAALGQVRLHCELKGSDPTVFLSETALVQGTGTHTFRHTAPARRLTPGVLFAVWLGDDWRRALSPIQTTPQVPFLTQEVLKADEADRAAAPEILKRIGYARAPKGNIAILSDPNLAVTVIVAEQVRFAVTFGKGQDFGVADLDAAALSNRFVLNRGNFDLLVLTDARSLPARSVRPILRFLREGGNLMAIGTPAFEHILHQVDGKWLDAEQIRQLVWDTPPAHLLCAFEPADLAGWRRATNSPETKTTFESIPNGKKGNCLRVHIPDLSGWDTLASPLLDSPFPKGHALTCFWAKGTEKTRELAIEWAERDGSRWIATIPLTEFWRHYALAPAEFRYWQDNPSKGRGGTGDCFNPATAQRITFGLAFTHTQVAHGEHTYWVDELGTAPAPRAEASRLAAETADEVFLETLSPAYKFYPITNARRLVVNLSEAGRQAEPNGALREPQSSHVRPQATGCDKGRPWRWIPLVEALDEKDRPCGFPATLLVHADGPFRGGTWAVLPPASDGSLSVGVCPLSRWIADRMLLGGLWLFEGGSRWYTNFEDLSVVLGATAANLGRAEANAALTLRVRTPKGEKAVFEQRFDAKLGPGQRRSWRATWEPRGFPDAPYRVETTLEQNGQVIDRLAHDLNVWRPKAKPAFITTKGLDFVLDGKPWYPHGVNYMPSSGIASEDGAYFECWLDPFPYDPEVIQTDLERIRDAGMNMVSVFIHHRSLESGNLLDLLRRCEALGLKVNLSLRPGTPLDFEWDKIRAIIERYRLAQNDTVFAYDLAWEPQFGNHEARRVHDAAWERWIAERYGSVENAEKDWGMPCPRENGKITNPSNEQVSKDGPWRVMVAAYRRFLDDLLADAYSRARRLVRSVDPNHLVSFRMTIAGDPTIDEGGSIPYDFRATAPGVDIVCPEGYGRIGDWDRVKAGAFTVAYARCVAPDRPLMWAEFGNSVWDRRLSRPDPKAIEWTADFYANFYKMALLSESAGTVCWWYPGGFRVGENSDYGIINPDGSDRPITKVIRDYAPKFGSLVVRPSGRTEDGLKPALPTGNGLKPALRTRTEPKHWITIDRDAHPGGLPAIYRSVEAEFWQAMDQGKFPALRHAGQGTTSADCPLLAVGNVPYTGENPPKLLNGLFAAVMVKNAAGQWQEVRSGDVVAVPRGQPVRARIVLTNTGFATWLAPKAGADDAGRVYVTVAREPKPGPPAGMLPFAADVPYLGETDLGEQTLLPSVGEPETRVRLCLTGQGRMVFGPKFRLTLRPAP